MPESLAQTEPLSFLIKEEKRILNQIRGNAYLCIFGLVEEFILAIRPGPRTSTVTGRRLSRPRIATVCG